MNRTYFKLLTSEVFSKKIIVFLVLIILALASEGVMVSMVKDGYFVDRNIYAFYFQVAMFLVVIVNGTLIVFDRKIGILKILLSNNIRNSGIIFSKFLLSIFFNLLVGILFIIPFIIVGYELSFSSYMDIIFFYLIVGTTCFSIQLLIATRVKTDLFIYMASIVLFYFIPMSITSSTGNLIAQFCYNLTTGDLSNISIVILIMFDFLAFTYVIRKKDSIKM